MLEIFNKLNSFIEDVFRDISVREYSREIKISPPTASSLLKKFSKDDLLISSRKGVYLYFRANRSHFLFKGIARLYWQSLLNKLLRDLHKEVLFKKIMLFGSIAKVENTRNSDIDLYVDLEKRNINVTELEKKLKRKIQMHFKNELANIHLKNSIEKTGIQVK